MENYLGVKVTKEKEIINPKGNIFHIIKKSSDGFHGFEEAYFTTINKGDIKGWKQHHKMTLNLAVPVGEVKFVITDKKDHFEEYILSPQNYFRLTVPPKLWVAFQGLGDFNLIINIANLEHHPDEATNISLYEIEYQF